MQLYSLLQIKRFLPLLFLGFAISCDSKNEIDISGVENTARIIRFDSAFFKSSKDFNVAEIERLSKLYPPFFSAGKTERFWNNQRNDQNQITLFSNVEKTLDNFNSINENLNFSMKHFYYYFPQVPQITFYGYISNLDFDYPVLYVPEESMCFVGLDMYLGPDKDFYQSQPDYQAHFRQPAFLVRDCLDAVIDVHVRRKVEAATLIDDMIYYGKRWYILQQTMPQKDPTIIAQYSQEQLTFCHSNERTIWAYFVENNHLFDSSQDLKRRFIELAPFSKFRMKFDAETPGMIGRWVGWQIVNNYMKNNPNITLSQLASETDSQKILKQSGYKP